MNKLLAKRVDHIPVLLTEVIGYLKPKPNQNFIDATVGGGGHTQAILERTAPQGKILAFDLDPEAIDIAKAELKQHQKRITFINDNYSKLKTKIDEYNFNKVSGIVCDLGYSSFQIEAGERGFSFNSEEYLDLRYNPNTKLTADEILNKWSETELVKIFKEYGEEPMAVIIAKTIILDRVKTKITGKGLKQITERAYARRWRKPSRIHPATRIWQALRIAVNQEFDNIEKFLPQALDSLLSGGRLAIISFHSGEDRIVKNFFRQEAKDCLCPKEVPKCICQHQSRLKIITKKPILASSKELKQNIRSRSARLRVAEKI